MKSEIIAKTQSGKEISCGVEIDEKGKITTQYPVEYAGDVNHEATYSIELTKSQFENLFKQKCPFEETVRIRIKNTQDWYHIENEADKIKVAYEKMSDQRFWEKCLKENKTLILSHIEGQNKIFGLPKFLSGKTSIRLSQIKINRKKQITAKKLENWIKTLEQERNNENDLYKKELMEKAKETGRSQILSSVHSNWNSHSEHWSSDKIITYIREDGSIFTKEVKAEPDHY